MNQATSRTRRPRPAELSLLEDDPLWYKDAVIYELHVRAFQDSDEDGIGDFRGLSSRVDYLQDLGVTGIWLLPFYPSPLKDDGYDIADYMNIHPAYGTMRDFKAFLRAAHDRGLRVITELVINHTSDQHAWFQRARRAKPNSSLRDFYVWSDTPNRYSDARIIFQDFEPSNWTWDPVAEAYYWHRFYAHQPDLNFDNPRVRKAIFRVLDFWFGLGVDGLRLDAVPYLHEEEGTNCENLPRTHEFIRQIRAHVDRKYRNRLLLAEANQWPEDAVDYFGQGRECHMAFHFPLMPRLFMAARMEDRYPVVDIFDQTPEIPADCQWALFLRNHDELSLEMVTDEEKDYMYRMYARDPQMRINLGIRRRLAPLLGGHRRRIELMNGLLFSLPGTPILYYGDELGMGDNIYLGDRNGVRTPMQWSADRNAGFSTANSQRLYMPVIIDPEHHYNTYNVDAEQNNPHSLLWWMKRLIGLRKSLTALGRGGLEFLHPDNPKILTFLRVHGEERILVAANLSRFVQWAELDLAGYEGLNPVELFGHTEFPPITEAPYFISLAPHTFFWFRLEPREATVHEVEEQVNWEDLPLLHLTGSWDGVFSGRSRGALERALPAYLERCRWFRSKGRTIESASVRERIPVPCGEDTAQVSLVDVTYAVGDDETYLLPLAFHPVQAGEAPPQGVTDSGIVRIHLRNADTEGVLYDALHNPRFAEALLEAIARRRRLKGGRCALRTSRTRAFRELAAREPEGAVSVVNVEQTNTSVTLQERFILKVFRKIEPGANPDLELGRFLTDRRFPHIPRVAGYIEYAKAREQPAAVAILQEYVPNEGDAWAVTMNALGTFVDQALALGSQTQPEPPRRQTILSLSKEHVPDRLAGLVGHYLELARLLGQRTAQMHLALASDERTPDFAPEPLSALGQRALYQSLRNLTVRVFQALRRRARTLPEEIRPEAQDLLERQAEVLARLRTVRERRVSTKLIRIHGDFHLGQVLHTGKDFYIIDFEGEPARSLSERRNKRSPLVDVAGMIRSFSYAAQSTLLRRAAVRSEDVVALRPWIEAWQAHVSGVYVRAYLDTATNGDFLPSRQADLRMLLEAFVLEKAVYELGYELNNRPQWATIPLQSIRDLLASR